jgi:hypothetical protein
LFSTTSIIKMVSFRKVFVAAMAAVPALAALSPAQVVSNIKMLTQKSQALQAPAQSITIINGPLIIIGQGPFPQLIVGFTDIVSTVTTSIAQMQGSAPVTKAADATAIYDAFREVCKLSDIFQDVADAVLVRPCSPGPPQHPYRKGWSLPNCSLHWPTDCCGASPGRECC